METIFYSHPWLFGIGFGICVAIAMESGFRLGRKSSISADQRTTIQGVEGALLGVLALLLSFTMAMAVSRFDNRRLLMLNEANAIGTAHSRAQLLPAPEGPEIAGLLREYVDVRVAYYSAGKNRAAVMAARNKTAQLGDAIWARVNTLVQKDNRSVPTGLLIQALNEAFDLEASGWTALITHIPRTVILLNAALALITMTFAGYIFALSGGRHIFSYIMLAIAVSVVLATIVDLDQPRGGFINISPQPMVDLQKSLAANH